MHFGGHPVLIFGFSAIYPSSSMVLGTPHTKLFAAPNFPFFLLVKLNPSWS